MKTLLAVLIAATATNANAWGWDADKEAQKAKKWPIAKVCEHAALPFSGSKVTRRDVYTAELERRELFQGRDWERVLARKFGKNTSYEALKCAFPEVVERASSYNSYTGEMLMVQMPWGSNSTMHITLLNNKVESWTKIAKLRY